MIAKLAFGIFSALVLVVNGQIDDFRRKGFSIAYHPNGRAKLKGEWKDHKINNKFRIHQLLSPTSVF